MRGSRAVGTRTQEALSFATLEVEMGSICDFDSAIILGEGYHLLMNTHKRF